MNNPKFTAYNNEHEVLLFDGIDMAILGVDEGYVVPEGKHKGVNIVLIELRCGWNIFNYSNLKLKIDLIIVINF